MQEKCRENYCFSYFCDKYYKSFYDKYHPATCIVSSISNE